MNPQPWWNDMRVLTQESDIRRLRPTPVGERVLRVIPRPKPTWGELSSDPNTWSILAHLDRIGFDTPSVIDGRAYVSLNVPPRPILVILTVADDDPTRVVRITYGNTTMTPVAAVRWLEGL